METKLLKKKKRALDDGNLQNLAEASLNLGNFYYENRQYEKALIEYKDEAKAYKDLGKELEEAKSHRMIGEMYMLIGEFEEALNHEKIYLNKAKDGSNKIEEQRAYATIGRCYLLYGQITTNPITKSKQLKSAEKAFIKSLLICKDLHGVINKTELSDMLARLYLNLGVTKEHMESFDESLNYIEKAIDICKKNDLFEILHQCYMTMGLLLNSKRIDFSGAIRLFNLGLDIAERLTNKIQKTCETLIAKADVLIKTGDFPSAKQTLHKAFKLKSPDKTDKETIEHNLRIVSAICYTQDSLITTDSDEYKLKKKLYEKMGDGACKLQSYSTAIEFYLKMLENAELDKESGKELIPIYVSLYQTYKDNNQYDLALEYMWKEYELSKDVPKEAFETLINIAETSEKAKKDFWVIEPLYQRARNEAKKISNKTLERLAAKKLLELEKLNGMLTLAELLERDMILNGLNKSIVDNDSDGEDEELVDSVEDNTPDIGDDIILDDLTDSCSDNEEKENNRSFRKRNTGMVIKKNNKGETGLHQACISGNILLATRLLDQGHPVKVRDHAGWLPLHEACIHGHRELVKLLLDRGGITLINDKGGTSCDGITPLYDSCSNGHLEIVELLLDRGANATLRTDMGDTTLNVLEKWRNTVSLDPDEQSYYNVIHERIKDKLEKAGVNLAKTNPMDSSSSSSGYGSNSGRSLRKSNCKSIYESPQKSSSDVIKCSSKKANNLRFGEFSDSDQENVVLPPASKRNNLAENSLVSFAKSNEKSLTENLNTYSSSDEDLNLKHPSRIEINTRNEYRSVMDNLRHRNQSVDTSMVKDVKSKRSAYLDVHEVDDEWLDDDLGPDKKKQKFFNDKILSNDTYLNKSVQNNNRLSLTRKSSNIRLNESTEKRYQNIVDSDNEDSSSVDSVGSVDAFDKIMQMRNRQNFKSNKKFSKRKRIVSCSYQPNLLECATAPIMPVEIVQTYPISTSNRSIETSLLTVKIKIEGNLFNVPFEKNDIDFLTIDWLAKEAAKRYARMHRIEPELRLMTVDGAYLDSTDSIKIILNESSHLNSIVVNWIIPPIMERYKDACSNLKKAPIPEMEEILNLCHRTQCLNLSDKDLFPLMLQPIFMAIEYEKDLTVLNLSCNIMQNIGMKHLVKILSHLQKLQSLNLSGNAITYDGVKELYSIFNINENALQELSEFNLNNNPICNDSVETLEKICLKLKSLKKLHLSDCSLSNFYNCNLAFNQLTLLDLSYNNLDLDNIIHLFNYLNPSKLMHLNLAFSIKSSKIRIGDELNKFVCKTSQPIPHFDCLNLTNCNLTDNVIYELLKNTLIDNLILINNQNLTMKSFNYLLNNNPTIKLINLASCSNLLIDINYNDLINANNDLKLYPEQITLSLPDNLTCEMKLFHVENLKELSKKMHGNCGKIITLTTKIKLSK